MNNRKIGFAIALASVMALGLAACGPSTTESVTSTTTETTVTEAPAMESVAPSAMPSTTP
jgi:ABC-type glycerol-3-phosphate transport system substrate-binding protein